MSSIDQLRCEISVLLCFGVCFCGAFDDVAPRNVGLTGICFLPVEALAVINHAPTQRLDVYVFGTNCYGELGLGDATKKSEIPGPVLNPKLPADSVGVVQLAIGGVHSAALTHDNKILTWGVNDEGTLGRDTKEERKVEENGDGVNGDEAKEESDSDSDDDEVDLNMKEATPTAVDSALFPEGTVFTQITATDSATFALTQEGRVYGWGTFRVSCHAYVRIIVTFDLTWNREATV